jgi:hypothetical protein
MWTQRSENRRDSEFENHVIKKIVEPRINKVAAEWKIWMMRKFA